MKKILIVTLAMLCMGCSKSQKVDIPFYFEQIKQAENNICQKRFKEASDIYKRAFVSIEKPFGKDVFNAALAAHLTGDQDRRDVLLQKLVNNLDQFDWLKKELVDTYLSEEEWASLLARRQVEYQEDLRQECVELNERDQLFRPLYETYDDTINANRKINLSRILELTDDSGFPSHIEAGYADNLREWDHDIVLYHTAQRRSYDKSVYDLEPLLFEAVQQGRYDPDRAIFLMNFQQDAGKGPFEVYPITYIRHSSLADSLQQKGWRARLDAEYETRANEVRKKWHANSLEDIQIKSSFLEKNDMPFIFTSVRSSVMKLNPEADSMDVLMQYLYFTEGKEAQ
jgi:hypothetical protein